MLSSKYILPGVFKTLVREYSTASAAIPVFRPRTSESKAQPIEVQYPSYRYASDIGREKEREKARIAELQKLNPETSGPSHTGDRKFISKEEAEEIAAAKAKAQAENPKPADDSLPSKCGPEATAANTEDDDNWVSVQHPETGEILGPRGLEPTRYGDWESKGRCWDF
jgi:hypothetical protein